MGDFSLPLLVHFSLPVTGERDRAGVHRPQADTHRMRQTAGVPGLVVRRTWDRRADRGRDRVLDRGV